MKRARILTDVAASVGAAAVVFGALVALFAAFFIVFPRRVVRRYEGFVTAHPVGSGVDAMLDDPFAKDAMTSWFDAGEGAEPQLTRSLDELRSVARAQPRGHLHLMWTHTPPFGRIGVDYTYEGGTITALRRTSVD